MTNVFCFLIAFLCVALNINAKSDKFVDITSDSVSIINGASATSARDTTLLPPPLEVAEINPEFPGGVSALAEWLSRNLKYPVSAQKKRIQGRVIVSFIVEKDGSIQEVSLFRSVDPDLDQEAIRVVKAMPRWRPGMHKGKNVRVRFALPITFSLEKKNNNK